MLLLHSTFPDFFKAATSILLLSIFFHISLFNYSKDAIFTQCVMQNLNFLSDVLHTKLAVISCHFRETNLCIFIYIVRNGWWLCDCEISFFFVHSTDFRKIPYNIPVGVCNSRWNFEPVVLQPFNAINSSTLPVRVNRLISIVIIFSFRV